MVKHSPFMLLILGVDKQSLKVDTREEEVPRLKALQDPPKWYLSVPEDEEMSIERGEVNRTL